MAITKITEGQTGQQVADLLYVNDTENATAAQAADEKATTAQTVADKTKNAVFSVGPYAPISATVSPGIGAIRKSGSVTPAGTEPDYNRTSVTAGNMFRYVEGANHYYTGTIGNANYAGVIFQDVDHNFLGYACGNVQTYNRQLLTPPAGTFFIGACSQGGNPVIEIQTETDKIAELSTDVAQMKVDFYDFLGLSGNITGGAISKTGGAVDGVAGYRRTSATNSTMFKVQPGKSHFYTGQITDASYAGVVFKGENFNFLGFACGDVRTYDREPLVLPAGTFYIAACSFGGDPVIEILTAEGGGEGKLIHVNAAYTGETQTGTASAPFKTITGAINANNTGGATILIQAGDYRETLPLAGLGSGKYRLIGKEAQNVRILGSNQLTGFTSTAGYSNVWQTPYTGSVPNYPRLGGALIFEDGNPSKEIEPRHYHPLQKNLTHRLPFTPILPKNTIEEVQETPGTYLLESDILYLHPSNSSNPNTNGFKYEVTVRGANTATSASAQTQIVDLEMKNLKFMFVARGFASNGFNTCVRHSCTVLGATGAGAFENSSGYIETWYEEAGFCNNDGENSHFAGAFSNYATFADNRSNYPTVIHNYLWSHDNGDDGESSHENHNVAMVGVLLEWNGDSGSRPSNDATYYVRDSIFRRNGWEVTNFWTTSNGGGEGFSVVNPAIGVSRIGCRAVLMNCVSEENNIGYGAISQATNYLEVVNSISRNNAFAEFFASGGATVVSRNSRATNADPAILKRTGIGGGIITVINDDILE